MTSSFTFVLFWFSASRSWRARRYNIQSEHEVLRLVKKYRHRVPLSLGFKRFLSVSILRMVCALPDRLRLSSSVVSTGLTPPCSGVLAAFLGALGFGLET